MTPFRLQHLRWAGARGDGSSTGALGANGARDEAEFGAGGSSASWTRRRFAPIIILFAVVALAGTLTPVVFSLNRMAAEANKIEGRLVTRSAEAAVAAFVRRIGLSHGDYAIWDDAVRYLYGTPEPDFVDQNLIASTATPTFFDTVYVLDEDDRDVFGYRNGEAVEAKAEAAFGPALKLMLAKLPRDGKPGVETGLLSTEWGLAAVAVGPIVPNTPGFADRPSRVRMLIVAKAFDEAAVERLGEDFVIDGLELGGDEAAPGVVLRDPAGAAVGGLSWSPPRLGREAHAEVSPTAYTMLGLLALTMAALTALAVRSVGRGNRLAVAAEAQQRRLTAALANMPHGLCMFDADGRLVVSNARYAELYKLPPHLVRPGTALDDIVAYRQQIGNAPVDFSNYVSHDGIEFEVGANSVFEFQLEDGRTVRLNHLSLRGGGYVATHEDVTEAVRTKSRMSHMARHDALTGLPNRVLFREKLEEALKVEAEKGRVAVLCFDLDRFKAVNDTLGHPIGDLLLMTLAARLRSAIGPADTIARLSGDEFAVVQAHVESPSDAVDLAEKIIAAAGAPYDLHGHQVVIGVSIGIAVAPDDGNDADHLLRHADLALHRAKSDGRGTYCFFESTMNAKVQSRRRLEIGLRRALAEKQFELHYQPYFSLKQNGVTGFEALLRWRDPDKGLISPAEFIPLAEETGLIVPIGEWVVRQACADAASWPGGLRVAVNLSAAQFRSRDLVTSVFSALASSHLLPSRLEIEITESVLLNDSEATLATLHQLRDHGVHISMDDFGTGYSSLSYLRSFPFDKIKIDQSFVRDIASSDHSLAIVRAVTGLGAALGIAITAEGVETEEQLDCLRREGCTEVQGYLISRPLSPSQLGEFLSGVNGVGAMAPFGLARSA